MKNLFFATTVMAILVFCLSGCGKKDADVTGLLIGGDGLPIVDGGTLNPKSYKEAVSWARESDKPILLIFSAGWCEPCQSMKQSVWSHEDVQKKLERYVVYKVDVDRERSLANRFGVLTLPAYAIVEGPGKMLRAGAGERSVEEIVEWLD